MTLAERHKRDTRLVYRARGGDQAAKAELFAIYDRLACKVSLRYHSTHMTADDLAQEARFGIFDAIERWDPKRGVQFMTVAAIWCRARAGRAVQGHLSNGARRVFGRGSKAASDLRSVLGRDPTDAELAKHIGVTEEAVGVCRAHSTRHTSLDASIKRFDSGEEFTVSALTPDTTERVDQRLEREDEDARVRVAVSRLSPRTQYILNRRYLTEDDGQTLKEIGDDLGLSRERIRQIEAAGLKALATLLQDEAA